MGRYVRLCPVTDQQCRLLAQYPWVFGDGNFTREAWPAALLRLLLIQKSSYSRVETAHIQIGKDGARRGPGEKVCCSPGLSSPQGTSSETVVPEGGARAAIPPVSTATASARRMKKKSPGGVPWRRSVNGLRSGATHDRQTRARIRFPRCSMCMRRPAQAWLKGKRFD